MGCAIPVYRELRFGLARIGPLVRRFQRTRPELVHLATPGPLAWTALTAARALGIPTTTDFRTNFHQYSRYYGIGFLADAVLGLLRRFHNLSDRTFVPTRAAARELRAVGFHNLTIVGRGVDSEMFYAGAAQRRAAPPVAGRRRAGAADGRPDRRRKERRARLARVRKRARAAARPRMVVVGDGPARRRLEAAHPDVRFVGVQRGAELAAHYASSDVFLFPSLSDTFGNVVMEALASALPVVSFAVAAAAEHVDDGVSGQLVAAGDEAAYIAAVAGDHRPFPGARADARRRARRRAPRRLARSAVALRGPSRGHPPCA